MPKLNEDTKLQILYEHYKDSYAQITDYLKLRDRLFFFILVTITLIFFQIFSPNEAGAAMSEFITKRLELQKPIDISFIGSAIWFTLLAVTVRYFQVVVFLERQWEYIHQLEAEISPHYADKVFTRVGKSYHSNYPLFSRWAAILYRVIFPALLLLVVFVKIYGEWRYGTHVSATLLFNSLIAVLIFISTILYLHYLRFLHLIKKLN